MSIKYERELEAQFDRFCKFECGLKGKYEIESGEIESTCDECGCDIFADLKVEVSPCKFCKVRAFIGYVRDEY